MGKTKAVILVGGASKGTRFRPLSLDLPKPLFQVGGAPMIQHHVEAAAKVPGIEEIILLGFYDAALFHAFIESSMESFGVRIRYLRESKELGTAGGLARYKDDILSGNPDAVFVIHCDVGCSFPLKAMLADHISNPARKGTVLGVDVSAEEAHKYGEMVVDQNTMELIHYAEKPKDEISHVINGGVYIFSPALFQEMSNLSVDIGRRSGMISGDEMGVIRLEHDVLVPMTGKGQVFVFKTDGFWAQMKDPAAALSCSAMYMEYFKHNRPHLLAKSAASVRADINRAPSVGELGVGIGSAKISVNGTAIIHPTAKIHPSAKVGPNVSIAAGGQIGAGARLRDCIILEDVIINDHAVVRDAIVGWSSTIGRWTRVQGTKESPTIFGAGVAAENEIIISNCVVLPHKSLGRSQSNEIIL